MGAGASTDSTDVDFRSLTAIHLPSNAEVYLEEGTLRVAASANSAGLLLKGDKLMWIRQTRVQSCKHARILLSAAADLSGSGNVLRVVVQRVLSSEAMLTRPAGSAAPFRYGLHMRTMAVGSGKVSTVEVTGVEGLAASTGAIAVGSEILTVNGEQVGGCQRVVELLRGVEAGATATLTLRHPPRMAPPRMHLSLDGQALATSCALPTEKASGQQQEQKEERIPTARIGEVSPPESARAEDVRV